MSVESFRSLKRMLIHYVVTAKTVVKKSNKRYESTLVGMYICKDLRSLIGPWNAKFPSTLQLRNAAERAKALAEMTGDPLDSTILRSLAEACRLIAISPSATGAADNLIHLHDGFLKKCLVLWGPDAWIETFRDQRNSGLVVLRSGVR